MGPCVLQTNGPECVTPLCVLQLVNRILPSVERYAAQPSDAASVVSGSVSVAEHGAGGANGSAATAARFRYFKGGRRVAFSHDSADNGEGNGNGNGGDGDGNGGYAASGSSAVENPFSRLRAIASSGVGNGGGSGGGGGVGRDGGSGVDGGGTPLVGAGNGYSGDGTPGGPDAPPQSACAAMAAIAIEVRWVVAL